MRIAAETYWQRAWVRATLLGLFSLATLACGSTDDNDGEQKPDEEPPAKSFKLVEATIGDIHQAIQDQEVTCREIVEAYIARSAAYNGPCTRLVTMDGEPIEKTTGYVRAGAPIEYPTETVPASDLLPDLDKYTGPPLDLGRMVPAASDPSVVQQIGLITGIPNAGQVNALESLNIRGERSVTCKGEFDKHPSEGALPDDAPEACEAFRKLPDALERATELDELYGNEPDLDEMPMYCVTL